MHDTFLRRLAELVEAGLPPAQALAAVRKDLESRRWRETAATACADVVAGRSLADAIVRYCGGAAAIVREGEASGRLVAALDAAARMARVESSLGNARRRLRIATLVAIGCAAVGACAPVAMLHHFSRTFGELGIDLRDSTRLVLRMSKCWPCALAAAGAVLLACVRRAGRTRSAHAAAAAVSAIRAGAGPAEALALAGLKWAAGGEAQRLGDTSWLAGKERTVEAITHGWAMAVARETSRWARWIEVGALTATGAWVIAIGVGLMYTNFIRCRMTLG